VSIVPILEGALAIATAGAASGAAIEAYRTRRAVEKHDRVLEGTDHRPGLREKVHEHRQVLEEEL